MKIRSMFLCFLLKILHVLRSVMELFIKVLRYVELRKQNIQTRINEIEELVAAIRSMKGGN